MKRLVLLVGLLAGLLALPAPVEAKAPCRNKVFNDWYRDGKIASTYPLACYRDALHHVPLDAKVYSSLLDDIKVALQAAIQRGHGKKVPDQVGRGPSLVSSTTPVQTPIRRPTRDPSVTATTPSSPPAATDSSRHTMPATSSSGGGVPTPLLVLGGLALVMIVLGAAGMGVRRFRGGAA